MTFSTAEPQPVTTARDAISMRLLYDTYADKGDRE